MVAIGLTLYDLLAGASNIRRHRRRSAMSSRGWRRSCAKGCAEDSVTGTLRSTMPRSCDSRRFSAARWSDHPRDDSGHRTAPRGRRLLVQTPPGEERFGMVINAAGPWMNELLEANHIRSRYRLTLVRGSHLVLKRRVSDVGILLQSVSIVASSSCFRGKGRHSSERPRWCSEARSTMCRRRRKKSIT